MQNPNLNLLTISYLLAARLLPHISLFFITGETSKRAAHGPVTFTIILKPLLMKHIFHFDGVPYFSFFSIPEKIKTTRTVRTPNYPILTNTENSSPDGWKNSYSQIPPKTHLFGHHADTCHGVEHCNQLFTPLMNRYHVNVLIAGYSGNSHIYTPDDNHKYSIAIGGNADEGNRTIIQIAANKDKISLKIIGENGELKSSYDADVDALENIKSGTNDIYVSGDKICVNTTSTDAIRVFSANGILLRTITPDSNITYISGLEKQTIYIVKAGKTTKKILL